MLTVGIFLFGIGVGCLIVLIKIDEHLVRQISLLETIKVQQAEQLFVAHGPAR